MANDRYVLSEPPIGAGGMGTVWKAYDTVLRRDVAVKELRIPDGLSPEERDTIQARALREARAAAGLDHPAIVTIHDVLVEDGRPWIVMRLLPGRSLDHAVRDDGPLSPRRAAELGARLLDALVTAHAGGVLHRDVKPQNIIRDGGGRWMLTDFGIASVAGATRTLTSTGLLTGTLGYVAPERLSGATPAGAADLWSVGATLYFAVEGRHAYDHDDLPAMIAAVLAHDPDPPAHAGPLAPVIAGLMERDPDRRTSAEVALEQLLCVAEGRPVREEAPGPGVAPSRPTERLDRSTRVLPEPVAIADVDPSREGGVGAGGAGAGRAGSGRAGSGRAGAPAGPAEESPDRAGRRVQGALAWLQAASGWALGSLIGLIVFSLQDGMPIWIAVALAAALAVGAVVGSWLAPPLPRWIGLPTALAATVLFLGESLVAAGAWGSPRAPVPAIIMAALAFVSFATWHSLAGIARRLTVPAERLRRVTTAHRVAGYAAILLGAACGYYLLTTEVYAEAPFDGNYPGGALVTAGAVVMLAGLLALPALSASHDALPGPDGPEVSADATGRRRRWSARLGAVLVLLVIPLLVGLRAQAQHIDRQDDFTTLPDICTSDTLSQERVAQLIPEPPEPEVDSGSNYLGCRWVVAGGADSAFELDVEAVRHDDSADAVQNIRSDRDYGEDDGQTVTSLPLGDEAIRYPYDGSIESTGTLGVSVVVRIDNVVLEVDFDQAEALGSPEAASVETLAGELVQEIEDQQPSR